MKASLCDKLTENLTKASQHNSQIMVKPEVILWPDPERQWEAVIPVLHGAFPSLLTLGAYQPATRQGPAIWLKSMVARSLPEADWVLSATPIIYLPGISKNDVKNMATAGLYLQPLAEYQYTGTIFNQPNGREWTILALLENQQLGLGIKVAQDQATKEALLKVLSLIFEDTDIHYPQTGVDSGFLHGLLFPNMVPNILNWICQGGGFIKTISKAQAEVFSGICQSRYGFAPDVKNIKAIVAQLGSQRNHWKQVWQYFTNAPQKYPELVELLRLAKPDDLGSGMFAYPEGAWPQVNEAAEDALRASLLEVTQLQPAASVSKLEALENQHGKRRNWVWAELGFAPLALSVRQLLDMARIATTAFPASSISELQEYYLKTGYKADQAMRWALASVKTDKDKEAVIAIIRHLYQPWLQNITQKFQALVTDDPSIFEDQSAMQGQEEFVLFVDALRYELALELLELLAGPGYTVSVTPGWSAIPSLTPTAKPAISPIADLVSRGSVFNEFRPDLADGQDLSTSRFRNALSGKEVVFVASPKDIKPGQRHWQEIGDIDTKGHSEQAGIVKRTAELFEQVQEALSTAFEKGIKKVRIVTDHGWLLLPGGLPKAALSKDLVETRWGRCALIKEGATTNLLHLPWRWNPGIFIAYAPDISFFKINEEYAHGGISLHECLVPTMVVESSRPSVNTGKLKEAKWINLACKIETIDAPDGYQVDIRTKYNEAGTSIVLGSRKVLQDNKITLMADDDAEAKSATIVLLNEQGVILDKKPTVVGG